METNRGNNKSDAEASLSEIDRTQAAARFPEVGWGLFVLNALLMGGLVLVQVWNGDRFLVIAAIGLTLGALNLTMARKRGVMGTNGATRGYSAVIAVVAVVIVGSVAAYEITDERAVVFAGAALVFVLMLLAGWVYRRRAQ